jgi:membrane protein implicated in regulation of membrane protease activity
MASMGLAPRQQGTLTSLYASIAYTACAVFVAAAGVLAAWLGFADGMWTVTAVVFPLVAVFGAMAFRPRRR